MDINRRQLLSFTAVSLATGCVTTNTSDSPTEQPETDPPTEQPETEIPTDPEADTPTETTAAESTPRNVSVVVGETFGGDQLSAAVEEVTRKTELRGEDSGNNIFLLTRLAVKNVTSNYQIKLGSPYTPFVAPIKDNNGYNYEGEIPFKLDKGYGENILAPGEVIRGNWVYELPDDSSGLEMRFDFSDYPAMDLNRVTVDLSEESPSAEELALNLAIEPHSIGDTISYDGLAVTVNEVTYSQQNNDQQAVVDVTFSNETGKEIPDGHIFKLSCKDGRGFEMNTPTLSDISQEYTDDTPLAPGETRRGKVPFDLVPKEPSNLYCSFEFSEFVEGQKSFWKLR
jgi:hypothetical protein